MENNSSPSLRIHFIDSLRALAMIAVIVCHLVQYGGMSHLIFRVGDRVVDIAAVLASGSLGVNLFLLISGFCLYWSLIKNSRRAEQTLVEYALRRSRRILPPYYAALVIFSLLGAVQAFGCAHIYDKHLSPGYMSEWVWTHALMIHNLFPAYILTLDSPLWSLALEFQLYLLFPIFVEGYRKWNKLTVLTIIFIACSAYRSLIPDVQADTLVDNFVLTHAVFGRCFEFALGMYVADVVSRWPQGSKIPLSVLDYVFVVVVIALGFYKPGVYADTTYAVLFAVLVLVGSRQSSLVGNSLSAKWLAKIGVFSYSVYLIHCPLIIWLWPLLKSFALSNGAIWAIDIALILPCLIWIGYGYYLLFEKPFMSSNPQPQILPSTARTA